MFGSNEKYIEKSPTKKEKMLKSLIGLLFAVLGLNIAPAILGVTSVAYAESVDLRPEIGNPVKDAFNFIKSKKYKEALEKIRETDDIEGKTPTEISTIERLRANAAVGAGDNATAVRAFEAVIEIGQLSPGKQLEYIQGLASSYSRLRDYPNAIKWLTRYQKEGGTDPAMHELLTQTYILSKNKKIENNSPENKEYHSRHILVKTEDEAHRIITSLKEGAKFEELAMQSKDKGSAMKGGDLGWAPLTSFAKPYSDAMAALQIGEFTDSPVKTQFGYHVIKLEETRPLAANKAIKQNPDVGYDLEQIRDYCSYVKLLTSQIRPGFIAKYIDENYSLRSSRIDEFAERRNREKYNAWLNSCIKNAKMPALELTNDAILQYGSYDFSTKYLSLKIISGGFPKIPLPQNLIDSWQRQIDAAGIDAKAIYGWYSTTGPLFIQSPAYTHVSFFVPPDEAEKFLRSSGRANFAAKFNIKIAGFGLTMGGKNANVLMSKLIDVRIESASPNGKPIIWKSS